MSCELYPFLQNGVSMFSDFKGMKCCIMFLPEHGNCPGQLLVSVSLSGYCGSAHEAA